VKKYYKIVSVVRGRLKSSIVNTRFAVEYKLNRVTWPKVKGSLLWAWPSLTEALLYFNPQVHQIYECLCVNPTPGYLQFYFMDNAMTPSRILEVSENALSGSDGYLTPSRRRRCVLASSIILTKRVK